MERRRPSGAYEPNFDSEWDIEGTLSFIQRRRSKIVALQFPDDLLASAVNVVRRLQKECTHRQLSTKVYLLADTSYNSLGVDEVAAAHIKADAMVHYGRASFTALSRLPTYFVLGQASLDERKCAAMIADYAVAPLNPEGMKVLLIFLDQPLLWAQSGLQTLIQEQLHAKHSKGTKKLEIVFAEVRGREREPEEAELANSLPTSYGCTASQMQSCDPGLARDNERSQELPEGGSATLNATASEAPMGVSRQHELGGYTWVLPKNVSLKECVWLWVGEGTSMAQQQLQLTYSNHEWAMLEPNEGRWQEGVPMETLRALKKRYYLVERAKNAKIVGILVGTLGAAGYKAAINQARHLAQAAGKKTYTLLMGKPSPAKLANFPEIEIFVHIADPQGHILDSKEYYAPIITPYEAQLAFAPGAQWSEEYRLDFESLLHYKADSAQRHGQARFSLLDSQIHDTQEASEDGVTSSALTHKPVQDLSRIDESQKHLVKAQSAAEYLKMKRSFQGLEAPIVGAAVKEPELAGTGRSGRAALYQGEAKQA